MSGAGTPPAPRQRLLDAATRLFAERGVQAVGVDTVVAEAGVAKASLYKHFAGKADLVAAVLADDEQATGLYRAGLARGGEDPRARLLALFDALDDLVSSDGWRGCRWAGAGLALAADPGHPAHDQVRRHKAGLRDLLLGEVRRARVADPEVAADQLLLLVEGTLVSGALRPRSRPARSARRLAELLLADPAPEVPSRSGQWGHAAASGGEQP